MEDIVAVEVTLESGESRYFMTWGRIQSAVEPAPLEGIILSNAGSFDLGGRAVKARLCDSLQEAARERYFFEALVSFSQRPIPYGPTYKAWQSERDGLMRVGKELNYLGRPLQRDKAEA